MGSSRLIVSEQPIDRNQRKMALDAITNLGAEREELGISYGDIFSALAAGEDDFSVRGVTLGIMGKMFKILGEFAGCVFILAGLLGTTVALGKVAGSAVKWLASFMKDSAADYDEEKDALSDLAGSTTAAMLFGLFPAWIVAPIMALLSGFGEASGNAPTSPAPSAGGGGFPSIWSILNLTGNVLSNPLGAIFGAAQNIAPNASAPQQAPAAQSGSFLGNLGSSLLKWGVGKLTGINIPDVQADGVVYDFESQYGPTIVEIRKTLQSHGL
jgi:hypothetical protein